MMKQSKWNEEKLEKLLQQMPKIVDKRNPQLIYQNISSELKKRKKRTWLVPTFASILTLSLIIILLPGMFHTNDTAIDNNSSIQEMQQRVLTNDSIESDRHNAEHGGLFGQEADEQTKNDNRSNMLEEEFSTESLTAVYEQDLLTNNWTFFSIPDQQMQNVVPITVLTAKHDATSWFEIFLDVSRKLTENKWGLTDYYPLNGEIAYEEANNIIKIDLPSNHSYRLGSASYSTFIRSLQETFSSEEKGVDKIVFSTEQESGFHGHDDFIDELKVKETTNRGYFLFSPLGNKPFLVPHEMENSDIKRVFHEMKQSIATHELVSAIPPHVTIDNVEEKDTVLHVFFSDDTQLRNDESMIYFIEAVLLTAKDFGYEMVKFGNTTLEQIGPFDLNEPLKVPIAANKRYI